MRGEGRQQLRAPQTEGRTWRLEELAADWRRKMFGDLGHRNLDVVDHTFQMLAASGWNHQDHSEEEDQVL